MTIHENCRDCGARISVDANTLTVKANGQTAGPVEEAEEGEVLLWDCPNCTHPSHWVAPTSIADFNHRIDNPKGL